MPVECMLKNTNYDVKNFLRDARSTDDALKRSLMNWFALKLVLPVNMFLRKKLAIKHLEFHLVKKSQHLGYKMFFFINKMKEALMIATDNCFCLSLQEMLDGRNFCP